MANPQQLVDDIRSFLQSSDQTYTDRLKALAEGYATACTEANTRLRRCEEYLTRGLRSEAIHFAQAEPVLLDVVAVLDFPERPQWEEVSTMYQLPAPPALRLDTAEVLNRAYAEEQPLEHLLRQHRRLALSHAPLGERLAVIRQLADLDPNNLVWKEDIGEFEKHRLKQLETEVEEALRKKDHAALPRLWDELHGSVWTARLAPALMDRLAGAMAAHTQHQKRMQAQQLANQLHDAYCAMDYPRVKQLAEEWQRLAAEAGVPPGDPLYKAAAPALHWLSKQEKREAEEARYQQALGQLQANLYKETNIDRLQELYQAVEAFAQGVPPEVEERFQRRLDDLSQSGKRREYIILAATLALGVIGLIVLVLSIMNH